jgi:hypothetical protein
MEAGLNLSKRSFLCGLGSALAAVAAAPFVPAPIAAFIEARRPLMWSEIITVTLKNRGASLAENVVKSNALLRHLQKRAV